MGATPDHDPFTRQVRLVAPSILYSGILPYCLFCSLVSQQVIYIILLMYDRFASLPTRPSEQGNVIVVSRARPCTHSLRWERVWSNSRSKLVLHCQHNCIHCGQLVLIVREVRFNSFLRAVNYSSKGECKRFWICSEGEAN